jgi:tetratricopeptide (TPR) repeat protein
MISAVSLIRRRVFYSYRRLFPYNIPFPAVAQFVDLKLARRGLCAMDCIRAWLKAPRNPFRKARSSSKRILDRFGGSLPSEPTLDQKIEVIQMGLQMTDLNDPARLLYLGGLASAFQQKYNNTRQEGHLKQWIEYAQQELEFTEESHRAAAFAKLGLGLLNRYSLTTSVPDLERSVQCARDGLQQAASDRSDLALCQHLLAEAMRLRYLKFHHPSDLEESISFAQEALEGLPVDSPDRASFLGTLDNGFECRYEKYGEIPDLDASIQYLERALEATPPGHPKRVPFLERIGKRYGSRFHRIGTPSDLDKSIQYHQQALDAVSETKDDPVMYFDGLAVALKRRYDHTGGLADLEQAIHLGERAAKEARDDTPKKLVFLSNIGAYYGIRYSRLGEVSDLDMSIRYFEEALGVFVDDRPERAQILLNLSKELRRRANLLDIPEDLDTAKKYAEDALDSISDDHPNRFSFCSNLGILYFSLYERSGRPLELDKAIEYYRAAVLNCPKDHPDRWKFYLVQLGLGLSARFGISLQMADLQEAIAFIEEAAAATPPEFPGRASVFNNLGGVYLRRYKIAKVATDLEAAIQNYRLAVESIQPDHADRPWHQVFLANALCDSFRRFGEISVLDEAIKCCQAEHVLLARKGACFDLLGRLYLTKFKSTESVTDLKESIRYSQLALETTSGKNPSKLDYLFQVGEGYKELFNAEKSTKDLTRSSNAFSEIFNTAELPTRRLFAGLRLVFNQTSEELWIKAADTIDRIVPLLSEVIPPSHSRDDAQNLLRTFHEISSIAPAIFLMAGRPAMQALEALENFRGIISSLTLDARSDVSMLKEKRLDLWCRYTECRKQLAAMSSGAASNFEPAVELSTDSRFDPRSTQRQVELQKTLKDVLREIRKCPKFEDFLLAPEGETILKLARDGPLVCFNSSIWGSHAFIVTTKAVEVITLPNIELSDVSSLVKASRSTARADRDPELDESSDEEDELELTGQMMRLWDHAVNPVLERLGMLGQKSPGEKLPRIWWVGGGIMSLIPLHAAGRHTPGSMDNTLSHVISSYVPTLKMLQHLRSKTLVSVSSERRKILVVTMPNTHGGYGPLNTKAEAAAIMKYNSDYCKVTHLERPSKDMVKTELATCTIAHFACHGFVDAVQPGESSLILGRDTVEELTVNETIDAVMQSGLNGAQVAYLSACSTAEIRDLEMLHESIHLASAFQLVGFQHVIGTLWKANDDTAVSIASKFYERLFQTQEITGESVSHALHYAVTAVRQAAGASDDLAKWACFIHIGC